MNAVDRYLAASLGHCQYPSPTEADPAKLCGGIAHHARVHNGAMLLVCQTDASAIERRREPGKSLFGVRNPTKEEREEETRLADAKWDAERAKRPPRKPPTEAQEEAAFGRHLRRQAQKGVL